jgi:hypothetical protein
MIEDAKIVREILKQEKADEGLFDMGIFFGNKALHSEVLDCFDGNIEHKSDRQDAWFKKGVVFRQARKTWANKD